MDRGGRRKMVFLNECVIYKIKKLILKKHEKTNAYKKTKHNFQKMKII